jgi:putative ABC transport system permease protein
MRLIFIAGSKSLGSNFFRTVLTILGIALGVATVSAILILDHNTHLSESKVLSHIRPGQVLPLESELEIQPWTQRETLAAKSTVEVLEEDYEMMRSAVRLASLLAFFIGAIIVFYTIGFSIQQRQKELALLTSLGATFRQVAAIILFEAATLGFLGSTLGLLGSWPIFRLLGHFNVTTTGRGRLFTTDVPWLECGIILAVGLITALLGALQPIWKLRRLQVSTVLQPRFLSDDHVRQPFEISGIFSLVLPIVALTYLLLRPFLKQVIPSIWFYLSEVGFIIGVFLLVIFFMPKVVSLAIQLLGRFFSRLSPLEVKLAHSRFSKYTGSISWPVSNIMLVFAFLLALHLVTKGLKQEAIQWGNAAVRGLAFVEKGKKIPAETLKLIEDNFTCVPMSLGSSPPNRVLTLEKSEIIKYLERSPELKSIIDRFGATSIILSPTLAQNLRVHAGDSVLIRASSGEKIFQIVGVTDKIGFFPGEGTYRERKSFALIEQQNAFLLKPEHAVPGTRLVLWNRQEPVSHHFTYDELVSLNKILGRRVHPGGRLIANQVWEINKDFVVFDVILLMSALLAGLGVTNTMLIQLQARQREIGLLQVLGMTDKQIVKLILTEGIFIGILGGSLANLLGVPVGWASIEALNALSVFKVSGSISINQMALVFMAALGVSIVAALYPALRSLGLRTRESLHYE